MTARVDWPRLTWPLALTLCAVPLGVLAGIRPEAAIVAAVGLAFMLVVFANLTTGVVIFTLLTFFELLPGAEGGIALSFTKIAGLLLAISWLAQLATHADARTDPLRAHPLITGILVLFLAWATISNSWSEQPADAFEAVYRLALNAVLFLIVYTAVRTSSDAIRVLAAFVIGATLAVAYGLLVGGVDPSPYGEAARLSSETENANELASTLVAAMALGLGLAFAVKEPALRLAMVAMSAFCMLGIVLTVSRSGLVSLGVAVLAAIVLSGRWRPKVTALASLVAVSALLYFAFFAPDAARERITVADGGTGREDIWKVAWRMVEDEPLRGVGAGNFDNSSIHYLLAPGSLQRDDFIVDTQKVAHNVYLETLAELGIVGLALLVLLILMLLVRCMQGIRLFERIDDAKMEILARAHLIALIGLLASLFFSSDQYKKQLWLMLAMGPAMLAIAREEADEDS